jgi:hypothetical protein
MRSRVARVPACVGPATEPAGGAPLAENGPEVAARVKPGAEPPTGRWAVSAVALADAAVLCGAGSEGVAVTAAVADTGITIRSPDKAACGVAEDAPVGLTGAAPVWGGSQVGEGLGG